MARQTFFIDSPASRVAAQLELVFDYVQRTTSTADDRAELLKALRAPAPPKPQSRPTSAQLELSLTQHEHEHEPLSAPAPASAPILSPAQETKPRKRIHKLIPAAGTTEKETSAIVSKEEWDAHMEQAQQAIHSTGKRTPIPETPYRPSVAKDKDEKPHVSLSSGVGGIFSLEVWGSLNDADAPQDPLPSYKECKGIMSDGQFGCSNPKAPGRAYCQHHLSLYCAKNSIQRDRLDAAARQRQVPLVSADDVRLARSKVRASNSNAGKGWKNLLQIKRVSSERRLAAAE